MNEAETRAEHIDPSLTASGWGVEEGTKILREYQITVGKIQVGGSRAKPLIADYVLVYRGRKLAVIEAKSEDRPVGEGVAQAKNYAGIMHIDTCFSCNGKEIYQMDRVTGIEGLVPAFPTPDQLWNNTFASQNLWRDAFGNVPFEDVGGTKTARYYQEIAVNNTMAAIAEEKQRILLTLATGTGKTFIAFQIAWKLYQTRWNLLRNGSRRPRILFLADRNILADQAYNAFSAFPEDSLVRISPDEIRKKGRVPTNGSIFFTIFQTFMSGPGNEPYFGDYPPDYFDFIIIDECHRGGANDEGNWRSIMEYFAPAVQLGLTATPKRKDNVDTYRYFGEPVYIYSLREGINDGFLTPFRVKRIQTTIDDYIYTSDNKVIEGQVEEGKVYYEPDFNRIIEIKEREAKRVQIYMDEADQREKTIVFCATQDHAAAIRDLINQYHYRKNKSVSYVARTEAVDLNYCVRVTANDGLLGEQYLREFQDNEKTIPTILTTSQKLSTGVDARNIRNIVLLRPINTMIEFKQIIGRGTRLFDGKDFFTIYDFVNAYHHFADPEWDGEPQAPEPCSKCGQFPCVCEKIINDPCQVCGKSPCVCGKEPTEPCPVCNQRPCVCNKKVKIKLRDGKAREIQHIMSTSFWNADGKPISAIEFMNALFGTLPGLFSNEEELRHIWSVPMTRKALLDKLSDAGYGKDVLATLQKLIDAEKSDLFDVLEYIAFAATPITREERVAIAQSKIFALLDNKQKEFLEYVLSKYIETGVEELGQDKLPVLLQNKYQSLGDAVDILGDPDQISNLFIEFQRHLYESKVA